MRWRELAERKESEAGEGHIKCYRVEISEMAVRKTPLSKDWTEMKEITTLSTEEKSFLGKGNSVCKGPEVGA